MKKVFSTIYVTYRNKKWLKKKLSPSETLKWLNFCHWKKEKKNPFTKKYLIDKKLYEMMKFNFDKNTFPKNLL